jgi:hypothetical protein
MPARTAVIPPGCDFFFLTNRWCASRRPPANGFEPSGLNPNSATSKARLGEGEVPAELRGDRWRDKLRTKTPGDAESILEWPRILGMIAEFQTRRV